MKKIESFRVDHRKINKGIYISRVDSDIVTYDIRMVKPNTPPFLENAALHTFEHLFATYVRNSDVSDKIVYVGPMGCRTGFYLLVRNLNCKTVIDLVKNAMSFISNFDSEVPGASEIECGNYKDHDLYKAKEYASDMLFILKDYTVSMLNYERG